MSSETVKLAMSLLERASITPEDNGCQLIIADRLKALGFEITSFPINHVSNLWAKKGKAQPLLCFAGHTDVVPTGELNAWSSPPFSPTIRDGKLFARGAADMKSSIAAMIVAYERFMARYPHPRGGMAFLITSDEEGPAIDGTQAVLKKIALRKELPQWCLVGEASSTHQFADTVKIGRRGSLTGILKIIGTQGHIAYPQLANNPIHFSLKPLQAMIDYQWDKASEDFPATSLQFSNIHAGTGANNVIPATIHAHFNLRFSPQSTPEHIKQVIENILKEHQCQYELNWHLGGKPFYTDKNSLLINTVVTVIKETLGYAPALSTSGGTSDGRFFAEYGCEVIEVGPINATIHQVNECIDVKELDKLTDLYEKILVALLS